MPVELADLRGLVDATIGVARGDTLTGQPLSGRVVGIYFRKTAGVTSITATLRAASVDVASYLFTGPLVANTMYDFALAYTPQDGVLRASISGLGAARLTPSA